MNLNVLKKLRAELDKKHYACKPGCFECCTVVPVTEEESNMMVAELRKLGYSEPPNGKGDEYCEFLTTEGRCSVYAQRPIICRSFSGTKYVMKKAGKSIVTQSCTYGDGHEETASVEFVRYGQSVLEDGMIIGSREMIEEMTEKNGI